MNTNRMYDRVSWLLLLVMCSSFLIYNTSQLSTISVALCCGLLFCVMAIRNRGRICIRLTIFHGMVMSFAMFCFVSSLWAANGAESRSRAITIPGAWQHAPLPAPASYGWTAAAPFSAKLRCIP